MPEPGRGTAVTVVSGLPRSGTSLVMQMLAAGGLAPLCDDARPADEDNPRGYFEYAPVKASLRDTGWIARAEGRAVKLIHRLLSCLPLRDGSRGYRVVLLRRDLGEVLASQRAMLVRGGAAPPPPEQDARLAGIFERELAQVEAWLAERPDITWTRLEHRRLLEQPAAEAERLVRFLALDLDATAMAACVEPGLYRQRSRPWTL